ncbi:MAG: hypothetical protein ACI9MR_001078 [Myxococcota bacterium]|jgi:hypothetical protein
MTKRDPQKTRGGKRPAGRKKSAAANAATDSPAAPKKGHRKGRPAEAGASRAKRGPKNNTSAPKGGPRQRRALTHVGGDIRKAGDDTMADRLAVAARPPESSDPRRITHGFHTWPARLHPFTAGKLIEASPNGPIADPFMGGGTVLVEAMIAGRDAIGSDINPIAAEVAWARTRVWSREQVTAVVPRTEAIVSASRARRRQRLPKDLWEREGSWYDPPALADLWSLAQAIQALPQDDPFRRLARIMLSSILIKASKQVSDSVVRLDTQHRFVPSGRVDQWLVARAREVRDGLKWLARANQAKNPPLIGLADARQPPGTSVLADGTVAAIVSSPPYPGIYDYVAHHQRRYAMLGFGADLAVEREIGARREMRRGRDVAVRGYVTAIAEVLSAWKPKLRTDGLVHLVVGDGQDDAGTIGSLPLVAQAGRQSGFEVMASVSQPRPTFGPKHRVNAPKEEHIITLRRAGGAAISTEQQG